jgi:Dictyostelium (slime mold) repeat
MAREDGFFDDLARGLADGSLTRGKALRLMGAAVVGGTLGSLGIGEASADQCKRNGKPCKKNSQCCSGICDQATRTCAPPVLECQDDNDCDDGNVCTVDSCINGRCVHSPIDCDDGDACTVESCDPAIGCVYTKINCDDGNACTDDICFHERGCVHVPIVGPGCESG